MKGTTVCAPLTGFNPAMLPPQRTALSANRQRVMKQLPNGVYRAVRGADKVVVVGWRGCSRLLCPANNSLGQANLLLKSNLHGARAVRNRFERREEFAE